MRLRGRDHNGRARVAEGMEATERLSAFLTEQRMLARSMGLGKAGSEGYKLEKVATVSADTVVVLVALTER